MSNSVQNLLLLILALLALLSAAPDADGQMPVVQLVPVERASFVQPETLGLPQPLPNRDDLDVLTEGELQAMALSRHPAILEGQAHVSAARSNWVQVGLRPNPDIGYRGEEIGDDGKAGLQGGFIAQRFVTGDKLQLNRQVATQQIIVAQQRLEADRRRVLNDVRIAFHNALISQKRMEVTHELVRIGQTNVASTEKAWRAKVGSRIDLLEAEVAAQTAEVELATAEAEHRAAWRQLAATVAATDLPPARLGGDAEAGLPELDWDHEFARLMSESPEIAAAASEIEQTRWALQRARAQRYPDIDIGAAVLKNDSNGDTVASVELSMPLMIYDRNQGGISEAAANYRAATQTMERLELSLQNRLAEAFRRYSASRMQSERYSKEVLPRAKESLELVQKAFALGEINFLQLLTTERTYNRANLVYLDSLQRAWQASIEIEGLLLVDSSGKAER